LFRDAFFLAKAKVIPADRLRCVVGVVLHSRDNADQELVNHRMAYALEGATELIADAAVNGMLDGWLIFLDVILGVLDELFANIAQVTKLSLYAIALVRCSNSGGSNGEQDDNCDLHFVLSTGRLLTVTEAYKMKVAIIVLLAIAATAIAAPQKSNRVKRQFGGLCDICKMLVKYVEDYAEEDEPSIEGAIDSGLCQPLGQAMDKVCEAMIHQFLPQIIHIIETDPDYTPESICRDEFMLC